MYRSVGASVYRNELNFLPFACHLRVFYADILYEYTEGKFCRIELRSDIDFISVSR